jgi:hypothetical protein
MLRNITPLHYFMLKSLFKNYILKYFPNSNYVIFFL